MVCVQKTEENRGQVLRRRDSNAYLVAACRSLVAWASAVHSLAVHIPAAYHILAAEGTAVDTAAYLGTRNTPPVQMMSLLLLCQTQSYEDRDRGNSL